MEYYKNESGQIAVLVSGGYGAGWSTWNTREVAYDKRVVEYWLSHKDDEAFMRGVDTYGSATEKEAKEFMASIGYPGCYMGGFADIHIEWIEADEPFIITEYDGAESLECMGDIQFTRLS